MNKKILTLGLILILSVTSLFACGNDEPVADEGEDKVIKIGCMTTSEPIVDMLAAGVEGYNIEAVLFDENNMPCTALKDGDVDGVILNHKAWMETFNKENGCDLSMVEPYWYYSPFRLYSAKYDSVEDIPDGATVVVPSDSTNLERSLLLLQQAGLIELGEKSGAFYGEIDIEKNPKNIQFIMAEITTAANSINDADAAVTPALYIALEGTLDPENYLAEDPLGEKDFPLGLIVSTENLEADWVKAISEYMVTDEAKEAFNAEYKGSYVYIAQK